MKLRKVVVAGAFAALAVPFVAYGGWNKMSGVSVQKQADMFQIQNIEKVWHKATTKKNLDLMMSLWAKNAVMVNAGQTTTGKGQIRAVLAMAGPFNKAKHWVSDTPAYKMRVTVNGNKGTLYFECHYINYDTGKVEAVVGADQEVRKINGKWLITRMNGASVTLAP